MIQLSLMFLTKNIVSAIKIPINKLSYCRPTLPLVWNFYHAYKNCTCHMTDKLIKQVDQWNAKLECKLLLFLKLGTWFCHVLSISLSEA